MARKSRKNLERTGESTQTAKPAGCHAALYARISVEDQRKLENDSIGNQIELLKRYAAEQPEIATVAVYADAGESGTNFERAAFSRMMADIQKGLVSCVIVKDLSRLGRNYIETGNYIEQIFPCLGVRFVAVNDHYDSARPGQKEPALSVPLKNIVNELYARDISAKVRTQFAIKQKKGEYLGAFAPYGYLKSPDDRHRLMVDPLTSPVVRDIFAWRLKGLGSSAIAARLNAAGIASPCAYRYRIGLVRDIRFAAAKGWHKSAVQRILANPVYRGDMVQGKQKSSIFLGNSRRELPPDAWMTVCGTHEPIIPRELFERAQERLPGRGGRKDERETKDAGDLSADIAGG